MQAEKAALAARILDYLESHHILTMATISKRLHPDATALEYVHEKFIVYVAVHKNSQKVMNIEHNTHVALEIHDPTPIDAHHVPKIQAIQAYGKASIIRPKDSTFLEKLELFRTRFPIFKRVKPESRIILEFRPETIYFLDYQQKLFHRDRFDVESRTK